MIDKLKNIFSGKTSKWNQTNNIVIKEMFENLNKLDATIQIIFKHLLISTDLFASELFGITNDNSVFNISNKELIQFKKFYSLIISFYSYNIAFKNKSISEDILTSLPNFCLDDETVKETIKIFNKFSKAEQSELSKVGFKVLEKVSQIFDDRLTTENNINSLQKLILYYNSALNSIHLSLKQSNQRLNNDF